MIASFILALHLSGFINASSAAGFLFVVGVMMLIAEIVFTSGIVAFNGLLALYVAYTLRYGGGDIFGQPIGWHVLFGIAFVEAVLVIAFIGMILHTRKRKLTTGVEGMIGHKAEIIEWHGQNGLVRIHGEQWKAQSARALELAKGQSVTVEAADGLTLSIKV